MFDDNSEFANIPEVVINSEDQQSSVGNQGLGLIKHHPTSNYDRISVQELEANLSESY